MKVLLSDGNGVTSRQLATILSRKNHEVHVLCPAGLTLTKFTSHVTKIHPIAPFGEDPFRWLDSALEVLRTHKIDALICSQEQVAILSLEAAKVRELGVRMSVPRFAALRRVMDKVEASRTLRDAGLAQPETTVMKSTMQGVQLRFPCYIKTPIGTASKGVRYIADQEVFQKEGPWIEKNLRISGQLVMQQEANGPLAMIQSVFCRGELLAWHACVRVRNGPSGGAAKKTSISIPSLKDDLVKMGRLLRWDGALSMDAILVDGRPFYIDINPRIVEPANALYSGVDLVQVLLDISTTSSAEESLDSMPLPLPAGREGVSTHQIILALLKAAESGRRAVLQEVFYATFGREKYAGSLEESTPRSGDLLSGLLVGALIVQLVIGGKARGRKLDEENVKNYALSTDGWSRIIHQYDDTVGS